MASELGSTSDPKDLIPGDPGKLHDLATTLNGWSKKFEKIGDSLRDLKIPGWTGQASDAFWPTLGKEKTNWYLAADAMSGAAKQISSYSSTLGWAQGQASAAIKQWSSGDHAAAETTLKAAQKQLKPEVEALTKKLDDLAGGTAHSPAWLKEARQQVDDWKWLQDHSVGRTSQNRWNWETEHWAPKGDGEHRTEKVWGKDENGNWFVRDKPADTGEDGEERATPGKKTNTNIKLAEWSGGANAWSTGDDWETSFLGDGKIKGSMGFAALGVDGSAGASVTNGRLQAGVSASAYLAQVSSSGNAEYGMAAVQGEAKAYAGADASATVGVGKDGLHAGAEAFAGAKATGSLSADVGGVGAGASGEAWAGVGASADADLGMKDGKFTIGGELGVGLGVGGKLSCDVTVDPHKMVDSVGDAADWVGDTWDDSVGSWL
ncbi:putative T7SS-secreted protein [Streptomyces sp. NPDC002076]